ncbi:MAG: molybdopterin-guanine dinucleotide biosynthesis protein B [Proteobacteria bacterium]|nr:molybdopterin-guanine dinucleotide biosynthesis protein B [Pseudomonadota bacterium]
MKPSIISIVGLSGSGKTTLLERLIRELKWRGLNVGTIKHSSHPHPMDMPGKDSWRHRKAGAERTLFVGPSSLQYVADLEGETTPKTLADTYMNGLDVVLVEGFLTEEGDKIEVVRSERSTKPICVPGKSEDGVGGLLAIMSDLDAQALGSPGVDILDLDDVEGLANFIMERFSLKGKPVGDGCGTQE